MGGELTARRALQKAFPGILEREAERLLSTGRVASYPAETVLCLEGAIEDKFYVILDGQVKVTKVINDAENRLLKHLKPGDFFGEMAIIHNAPRAATVTTTLPSSMLEIDKGAFEQALKQSSSVSMAMVREVSQRLRENDEMAIEDLRLKAGELAAAYQQLAELELARREFLTTIAHELRTPLTSASGYLQMLRTGVLGGEGMQTAIDAVSRNVERIVSLTNDILFLQEMDLILSDFQPVEVDAIVSASVEAERGHARKAGVGLRLNMAPNLPAVPGDAGSLQRAFTAIINNAIKFSSDGGEVEITVGHAPSYVWVKVQDEGIGIPREVLPRIYDRFFRVEEFEGRLFGGVGIGLSIARQVIEQHGGGIEAESEVNKGTVFSVRLKKELELDA